MIYDCRVEQKRTDEYTVWLEPSADSGEILRDIIAEFARRAGTPMFEPHVTLLPGLSGEECMLTEKTAMLAGSGPFTLSFQRAVTGEEYHKCLYLECERSNPLLRLRARGEELFAQPPVYHPHLSLAYGLSDEGLKAAFTAELAGQTFDFAAERVSLWHARGLVEEWRKVEEFSL